MLASTVQFSSNDQPPTTPTRRLSSLGPASRRSRPQSVPSDTQQRARPTRSITTFHAEAVLVTTNQVRRIVNVPPMSNQHQTFADVLASDPDKSE
ncbi:hypothetical protein BKA18_002824 [Streptomyces auratus]